MTARSNEKGFTLIELTVTLAIVGVLSLTATSNYSLLKKRSFDAAAVSDYRNLKTVVLDETLQEDQSTLYNIRGQTGPTALPEPLNIARLSDNVRLNQALKRISVRANGTISEVIRIDLEHLSGQYIYRYSSIDGNIVEQVIEN